MARWRTGGLEAVDKRSTRPKSNPNAIDANMTAVIISLRHELTHNGHDAGARSLWDYLTLQGHTPPSITTIWRILTREGLITPEPRKRPRRTYLRFEADLPNECWQSDFTHHKLANGRDIEIITWLDDHSRFALHISAHMRITGAAVLHTFTTTINTHGMPASTLTDNGLVFTTRHRGGAKRFRTRAHDPRNRTEKRAPQPSSNARKSRTIPTNTEEMAHPTTPSPNARDTPTTTQ